VSVLVIIKEFEFGLEQFFLLNLFIFERVFLVYILQHSPILKPHVAYRSYVSELNP